MIDGVETAWIEKRGDLVSIQLRFEEGLEREVVYRVVEKDKKEADWGRDPSLCSFYVGGF